MGKRETNESIVIPMIKTIFIFFSYLAFLLLGLFSSDTVLIENNTPAVIASGVRSLVEVNIRKGDVKGFSKLELSLPEGFIATPGDIKGASFTFSGDKAKFVWMDLPDESLFKVTYYIESQPGAEGAYEIKGTFSYVRENIREDIYVPTRTVVVKQDIETPADAVLASAPVVRVEQPVLEMSCERRIERLGDNEYLVRLKVNNNRIVGFGKILEILPDNCQTNRDNDGGAVITQDANSIKFVWFEVPTAPTFEISYRVMCISDGTVPAIRGQLSYTENGNPFTVDILQTETPADLQAAQANAANTGGNQSATTDSSSANAQNTAGITSTDTSTVSANTQAVTTAGETQNANNQSQNNAANVNANVTTANQNASDTSAQTANTVATATNTNQNTSNASSNSNQNNNGVVSNSSSDLPKNNVKSEGVEKDFGKTETSVSAVNTVPSAEKGITYKVQILAAHRLVDKSYLKKKFSFEEDYNIENHNGWIKYTTGMYAQYKDARDARVRITNASSKLPGPFVTAYNDGERITVQEALLVSKQLWYK
ncbi:MAG: hypothetical protein ACK5BL_05970 [Flavobacteriales bacterium]